jgi:hypothetical protein
LAPHGLRRFFCSIATHHVGAPFDQLYRVIASDLQKYLAGAPLAHTRELLNATAIAKSHAVDDMRSFDDAGASLH